LTIKILTASNPKTEVREQLSNGTGKLVHGRGTPIIIPTRSNKFNHELTTASNALKFEEKIYIPWHILPRFIDYSVGGYTIFFRATVCGWETRHTEGWLVWRRL